MNKLDEVRKVTDEMALEISNYIHNADISGKEKATRRLELAATLFMGSVPMNSEEIAKDILSRNLFLLANMCKDTINTEFHAGETNLCTVTKMNEYEEKDNEY
jgi:hypothetical protein